MLFCISVITPRKPLPPLGLRRLRLFTGEGLRRRRTIVLVVGARREERRLVDFFRLFFAMVVGSLRFLVGFFPALRVAFFE